MKIMLDIPSDEFHTLQEFLPECKGKILKNGLDVSLRFFTPQDAMTALKAGGLQDDVLDYFDRETIIGDVLRKTTESFTADIPVNYERFALIAHIVAMDYNERFLLIQELPEDEKDFKRKKRLITDGLKPIDLGNPAEINEIRVALLEAMQELGHDIELFLGESSEDNRTKVQAGLDFIYDLGIEIDNRLFLSSNIMDKEGIKAMLFPTVMPYEFDKESDYLFACASGFDSLSYFLERIKDNLDAEKNMDERRADLFDSMNEFVTRPFGGKSASVIMAVLKKEKSAKERQMEN